MDLDHFQLIDRIVDLNLDEKKITVEAQVPAVHSIFEKYVFRFAAGSANRTDAGVRRRDGCHPKENSGAI